MARSKKKITPSVMKKVPAIQLLSANASLLFSSVGSLLFSSSPLLESNSAADGEQEGHIPPAQKATPASIDFKG
jgi:hypothetical protein